jgi:hypothetical protein
VKIKGGGAEDEEAEEDHAATYGNSKSKRYHVKKWTT